MREECSGPGQGTLTASRAIDEPAMSPFGDHKNDKKIRSGRPAKQWRDSLDEYDHELWFQCIVHVCRILSQTNLSVTR